MNIDKVFGNKYNPDKLVDVNGDELHDCDIVETICGNYDNCVCRQRSIKSRFAVIDEHCSMYMEYYLMKLKHDGEIGEK